LILIFTFFFSMISIMIFTVFSKMIFIFNQFLLIFSITASTWCTFTYIVSTCFGQHALLPQAVLPYAMLPHALLKNTLLYFPKMLTLHLKSGRYVVESKNSRQGNIFSRNKLAKDLIAALANKYVQFIKSK